MATRKMKRYNGEDSSYVEDDAVLSEAQNAKNTEDANEARGEAILKNMRDSAAAPKTASKPVAKAASKPAESSSQGSGVTRMSKEAGEAAQAKFRESATPAPKKEMYRTFGGKMAEKAPETDRFKGVRESIGSGLKSAGEGIGNYLRGLGRSEEKHGTYVKDGKVVRYAKGGMTASKRADGIATRGKTRGKMC